MCHKFWLYCSVELKIRGDTAAVHIQAECLLLICCHQLSTSWTVTMHAVYQCDHTGCYLVHSKINYVNFFYAKLQLPD